MSKSLYHLSYRGAQGFVQSLTEMLKLDIPVPSYTQICRRAEKVKVPKFSKNNISDVVIDSIQDLKFTVQVNGELTNNMGKAKEDSRKKLHLDYRS